MRSEKESTIEHGLDHAIEAPRLFKELSANGTPLKSVSQSLRDAFQHIPSLLALAPSEEMV